MYKLFAPAIFLASASAFAGADTQYTVVALHPSTAAGNSFGLGGRNGQQVGNALLINTLHHFGQPVMWTGSAASVVNLEPAGHEGGFVYDTDGSYQVGETTDNAGGQTVVSVAAMWHGSAGSYINMSPPGLNESYIGGIDGGIEVGTGRVSGGPTLQDIGRDRLPRRGKCCPFRLGFTTRTHTEFLATPLSARPTSSRTRMR